MLCSACGYLDILEKIAPISILFEEGHLLPSQCQPIIFRAQLELEDTIENIGTPDELLDSHFARFLIDEDEDEIQPLSSDFVKHGHMLRKLKNCESVKITFENFTFLNKDSIEPAQAAKKDLSKKHIEP